MLHLLWLILKIILAVIGLLLAVVLLLLLLILFCPIRYEAYGVKHSEDHILNASANAKVSWLFKGIAVRLDYANRKPVLEISVFGVPLDKISSRLRKKEKKKEAAENRPPAEAPAETDAGSEEQGVPAEEKLPELEEKLSESEEKLPDEKGNLPESEGNLPESEEKLPESEEKLPDEREKLPESEEKLPDEKEKPVQSRESRETKSLFQRAADGIGRLSRKVHEIHVRIVHLMENAEWWWDFITDERTGFAISCVLGELKKILKHILPRKVYGHITFGFEDPSITGRILAAAGMTLPLHRNSVKLDPRFDDQDILDAEIRLSGRILGIRFLVSALRVLLNKDVRFVYRTMKHKEVPHGKGE